MKKVLKATYVETLGGGVLNVHKTPYDWPIGGRRICYFKGVSIVKSLKLKDGDKIKVTLEKI